MQRCSARACCHPVCKHLFLMITMIFRVHLMSVHNRPDCCRLPHNRGMLLARGTASLGPCLRAAPAPLGATPMTITAICSDCLRSSHLLPSNESKQRSSAHRGPDLGSFQLLTYVITPLSPVVLHGARKGDYTASWRRIQYNAASPPVPSSSARQLGLLPWFAIIIDQ